ncbi:MAG: phosphatase PAP2 family protein [Burkholderiales bacterium]|nr:phosphatase PAP2 family protein [Burkholderiales bacterium]
MTVVALIDLPSHHGHVPNSLRAVAAGVCGAVLAAGCAGVPSVDIPASPPELRPGVLAGYLPRAALPDSLTLLPPPPAAGSPLQAADEAAYAATHVLKGSARWAMAQRDNNLAFPAAAGTFACTLGVPVSAESTPNLVTLLRRSYVDAGLATYAAKDHYRRKRPFDQHQAATCVPHEDAKLAKDGSYPSGHAALGWAWGLILAEMAPDRADALLARGHAFGQSRVVCGAHWQTDVDQGRVVGAAALARLRADPVYRAQFDQAKAELLAARQKGLAPAADCADEAVLLKRP